MINEWVEFCAYTGTVSYTASKKSDTTWLGRFTFATILEFEGMSRILTVLARVDTCSTGRMEQSFRVIRIIGSTTPAVRSAPGAVCRRTESVCGARSGSSRQTFRSCIQSSRSWWMRMGSAGSSVMFSVRRTSC